MLVNGYIIISSFPPKVVLHKDCMLFTYAACIIFIYMFIDIIL